MKEEMTFIMAGVFYFTGTMLLLKDYDRKGDKAKIISHSGYNFAGILCLVSGSVLLFGLFDELVTANTIVLPVPLNDGFFRYFLFPVVFAYGLFYIPLRFAWIIHRLKARIK